MFLAEEPDIPIFPPTDLLSHEPPLESDRHLKQLILLLTCLERLWQDRYDFFAGGNMSIYYSVRQVKSEDVRGPDFFVVLGTERRERKSWVVWAEGGKYPNLIIELLSDSTAASDRGLKKQIYQDIFRTPEYFWFHPHTLEFKGYRLNFRQYEEIQPDSQGRLWSEELQLFLSILADRLRLFTPSGELVPTPEEAETQANQQTETERQRAEQAEAEVARLQQKLRELGAD